MNSFDVEEIKALTIFNDDLYIDNAFLLTPANCAVEESVLKALAEWRFTKLYSNGSIQKGAASAQPEPEQKSTVAPVESPKISADVSKNTETVDASEFLGEDDYNKPLESSKPVVQETNTQSESKPEEKSQPVQKTTESDNTVAKPASETATINDPKLLEQAKKTYFDFMEYANKVYMFYATNKEFNNQEINTEIIKFCDFIKTNRNYVLRIISDPTMNNKNFLINHCIRSTVVAVTIGLQLKMPEEKLVELGVACFLHEIGMILLPPQLYMNDKQLTGPEKLMLNTHPIVSYNILKKANFSTNIQMGVLEHHERINGSGYPRHITGEKTSLYAKIIAVACSFEAISAPREYKEERTTFEALLEMLRNTNKQYDEIILKALLYSISLYPIGIYVYLSNGKIAQVIDVSASNPKAPTVQILGETDASGNQKIVQVDSVKFKIIRVLNKKEVNDALKSVAK